MIDKAQTWTITLSILLLAFASSIKFASILPTLAPGIYLTVVAGAGFTV